MKNNLAIIIFFISVFFTKISFAQNAARNIENQQDWISRDVENRIEGEKRFKEKRNIKKNYDLYKQKQIEEKKLLERSKNESAKCFKINEINLVNAKLISKNRQKKIVADFVDKCFDNKIIVDLVNFVNQYYRDKGYISVQVLVPKQNIEDGILDLEIIEGKIAKIIVGKNDFSSKLEKFTAFGNIENENLDINEINQGIYQINRLQSNNAVMKIEPAKIEGFSDIIIDNQKEFPLHLNVSYDNLGNEFTGIRKVNSNISIDNLLRLNDNINLSYSGNLEDDNKKKDLKVFAGNISIPYKYYTINFDLSRSEFLGIISGINNEIKSTGYSTRANLSIERVLINRHNLRLATFISIAKKQAASFNNYRLQENTVRRLSIANFGFSFSNIFENDLNIYAKPSYSKGLRILDAQKNPDQDRADFAKSQFDLLKLYASISKKFLVKNNFPLALSTEFDGQISKDTLFGSEQFSVGGYHSVRGFRENYIIGDSGYYLRNKASLNLGYAILPFVKNKEKLSDLYKFKIEPFYDYGFVYTRFNDRGGDLAGAGLKTIFDSKNFSASITYSAAVKQSDLFTTPQRENKMLYFEISANCC